MTNDAPHKRSAISAAKLRVDCASDAPEAQQAAEAFFALWQQTLRDAAGLDVGRSHLPGASAPSDDG